jgi:coenzyme F420-reducing hydrogenase gamma subunit
MGARPKPRVGVVKLTSCDGCQLTLLDMESELLPIAARFDLVDFPEASSVRSAGPYDVLLVEGSVSGAWQIDHLVHLRSVSRAVVTIGACATSGGIQALRNWSSVADWAGAIYADPSVLDTMERVTPVADHIPVDAALVGCPIAPGQLRELLAALLAGRRPRLPDEAVCLTCKRRGLACVIVSQGLPCLGPVTRGGCGALCPSFARGCYGCFGPREQANVPALIDIAARWGVDDAEARRLFAGFTAWAPEFRAAIPDDGPARPAAAPTEVDQASH